MIYGKNIAWLKKSNCEIKIVLPLPENWVTTNIGEENTKISKIYNNRSKALRSCSKIIHLRFYCRVLQLNFKKQLTRINQTLKCNNQKFKSIIQFLIKPTFQGVKWLFVQWSEVINYRTTIKGLNKRHQCFDWRKNPTRNFFMFILRLYTTLLEKILLVKEIYTHQVFYLNKHTSKKIWINRYRFMQTTTNWWWSKSNTWIVIETDLCFLFLEKDIKLFWIFL